MKSKNAISLAIPKCLLDRKYWVISLSGEEKNKKMEEKKNKRNNNNNNKKEGYQY